MSGRWSAFLTVLGVGAGGSTIISCVCDVTGNAEIKALLEKHRKNNNVGELLTDIERYMADSLNMMHEFKDIIATSDGADLLGDLAKTRRKLAVFLERKEETTKPGFWDLKNFTTRRKIVAGQVAQCRDIRKSAIELRTMTKSVSHSAKERDLEKRWIPNGQRSSPSAETRAGRTLSGFFMGNEAHLVTGGSNSSHRQDGLSFQPFPVDQDVTESDEAHLMQDVSDWDNRLYDPLASMSTLDVLD